METRSAGGLWRYPRQYRDFAQRGGAPGVVRIEIALTSGRTIRIGITRALAVVETEVDAGQAPLAR